jgi:hypothetical protein
VSPQAQVWKHRQWYIAHLSARIAADRLACVAARETAATLRERALSRREAGIGWREEAAAAREAALARRAFWANYMA